MSYDTMLAEILSDPSASDWLKTAARTTQPRDPVDALDDALDDALALAGLLKLRLEELIGPPIPVGDAVVCDICGKDYTNNDVVGGFIFRSEAYCPGCAWLNRAKAYSDKSTIFCPSHKTFADFVREYRGNAAIEISHD